MVPVCKVCGSTMDYVREVVHYYKIKDLNKHLTMDRKEYDEEQIAGYLECTKQACREHITLHEYLKLYPEEFKE